MMNQAAESSTHWGRLAITNITLALLQDSGWSVHRHRLHVKLDIDKLRTGSLHESGRSRRKRSIECRYDVKYGSAGFNSYGYRGGCTFVFGTFDEVLADPVASRFVCPPEEIGTIRCFDDYSGQGVCRPLKKFDQETYEDLFVVDTSLYQVRRCCVPSPPPSRSTVLCRTAVSETYKLAKAGRLHVHQGAVERLSMLSYLGPNYKPGTLQRGHCLAGTAKPALWTVFDVDVDIVTLGTRKDICSNMSKSASTEVGHML